MAVGGGAGAGAGAAEAVDAAAATMERPWLINDDPDEIRELFTMQGLLYSVAAVMVVHRHRFPHLLLLKGDDGMWYL